MSKWIDKKDIPEVGKFYHFWDDGKHSVGRHYIAKVEKIIPFEEAENMFFQFEIFVTTVEG